MRNTITLNGIASTTIAGLLIQELPAISKPLMRTTIEEIDGRDGDIVTELGYSAYDKEITIGLYGSFDINTVIAYFATEGTVVFSNEPDKFYRYKIIDQIDYERLVRYRTATVKLHCQPFKYPTSETPVQLGSGQTVTAEGTDLTMQGTALAPFVAITPKGDTSQQTYTGKNLVGATATFPMTVSGLTATKEEDGSITLNGTRTAATHITLATGLDLSAYDGQTLTLSVVATGSGGFSNLGVKQGTSTNLLITAGLNGAGTRTTTDAVVFSDYNNVLFDIWISASATTEFNNYNLKIQLEKGETATDYEQYVGGTAAPNPEYPQEIKMVTGEQTVTVTGRNRANVPQEYSFTRNTHAFHLKAGRYYVSCGEIIKGGQNPPAIGITGNNFYLYENTLNRIFDLQEDKDITVYSNGWNWNNSSVTSTVKNLIFSETPLESLNDYQPYGKQEYELNLGKNLFNKNDLHMYRGYISGAGILSQVETDLTTGQDRFIYVECEPNTTYTITKPLQHTTANNRFALGTQSILNISSNQRLSDSWSGGDGTTTTTHTVTTSNDAHYLIIYIGKATNKTNPGGEIQDILDGLQIEKGSTATTYAPYFEPIELCKIGDYQDYIYKSGDKWYKHEVIKKTTLPTSGYTRWSTDATARMYYKNGVLSDALFQTDAITAVIENLPVKPQVKNMTEYYDTYAQVNKYGFVLKTDTPGIMIQNKDQTAVADFHAWIAANPVVVRYVLATQVDTKITNEALIEQLNALGNANSYRDTTDITTASNGTDLPVILAVTATGKADGTVTNAGNTYAKPKLTIYGTGNIGIYLNGSQMFQIELGSEGYITIDTEKMEAYKDTESNLKNRLVTGDYSKFRLEAGANQINFSGNINKCVVENYTRWL
jgi:predicted phage tail component-like protein